MFLGKLIEGVKGKIVVRTKLVEEKKLSALNKNSIKDFLLSLTILRRVWQLSMCERAREFTKHICMSRARFCLLNLRMLRNLRTDLPKWKQEEDAFV